MLINFQEMAFLKLFTLFLATYGIVLFSVGQVLSEITPVNSSSSRVMYLL